ncbi:hypothetical protein HERIO_1522 [Hepatospora eriocheir]|uniref:Transmembrane protein n=1 Tax=Hepatospora eriocheir TaxID=1081669 RepID=A0A1X0Q9W1_9MICR|nr:hypothetical protein HERIO_1522 [Hepatospora eriocheir]
MEVKNNNSQAIALKTKKFKYPCKNFFLLNTCCIKLYLNTVLQILISLSNGKKIINNINESIEQGLLVLKFKIKIVNKNNKPNIILVLNGLLFFIMLKNVLSTSLNFLNFNTLTSGSINLDIRLLFNCLLDSSVYLNK